MFWKSFNYAFFWVLLPFVTIIAIFAEITKAMDMENELKITSELVTPQAIAARANYLAAAAGLRVWFWCDQGGILGQAQGRPGPESIEADKLLQAVEDGLHKLAKARERIARELLADAGQTFF